MSDCGSVARYFRRHWNEDPGFELAGWGESVWLFEADDDGRVVRQVEVFENGNVLSYDASHDEDECGGLSVEPLDLIEFAPFEITADTFAAAVATLSPLNR
jgi:hypothetical protein